MLFDEDVTTTAGVAGDDTANEPEKTEEKPEGEEAPQDGEEQNV
jgi:hypothetical protein